MKFPSFLKSQNTIIAKYLMRNVLVMLSAVFIIIGLVVFGNQLVLVINQSLKEGIPVSDLLPLIIFSHYFVGQSFVQRFRGYCNELLRIGR